MEKENKDKNIILTDEELKEVAGGTGWEPVTNPCAHIKSPVECLKNKGCIWTGSKCTLKPNS